MKIYTYHGNANVCGKRVRETRRRLDLTQEDLAAKLQVAGVTMERDSISRIEIGTRHVFDYEVLELSKIFGVSALWLLGIEE